MKHCGHLGAVITVLADGRPVFVVCHACAEKLAARWLREGCCYGSCVDAVEQDPRDPRCIRYKRPWEPSETCLHCGHRRGSCIWHRAPELVVGEGSAIVGWDPRT